MRINNLFVLSHLLINGTKRYSCHGNKQVRGNLPVRTPATGCNFPQLWRDFLPYSFMSPGQDVKGISPMGTQPTTTILHSI